MKTDKSKSPTINLINLKVAKITNEHLLEENSIEDYRELCWNLGELCYDNIPSFDEQAFTFYKIAADLGLTKAQGKLGWMYQEGRGTTPDDQKAFVYYKFAADKEDYRAEHAIACIYENGWGKEKLPSLALDYMLRAAKQGHLSAQEQVAGYYRTGFGCKQDMGKCKFWLNKAENDHHFPRQIVDQKREERFLKARGGAS